MLVRALHRLPPETAHAVALFGLRHGLVGRCEAGRWPRLRTTFLGHELPNPLGLAAGFDKDGAGLAGLGRLGFGFIEVGTVTPAPQIGNPKPRIFRLPAQRALINRMGFNNQGAAALQRRLERRAFAGLLGVNLGANKASADPAADYVAGLQALYRCGDYFTINVSSPNTPGLRRLQGRALLAELLQRLLQARAGLAGAGPAKPLLLKIAPDLAEAEEADIAAVLAEQPVEGLIISNTTLARPPGLRGAAREEAGGLSGPPLFAAATAQLRRFRRRLPALPLIGVGGIASGADAYAKIRAGASALQLYTAFVYQGPALIPRLLDELDALLARDGHRRLQDAVSCDA